MKLKSRNSMMIKTIGTLTLAATIIIMMPLTASAHCDTMDGPTVIDGVSAMENNNINYVLKWVQPEYEDELTNAFNLSMKVKDLSPEAREIAERYFFENLVRIHRVGEGAPYDGVKPSGTPIDEKVAAADKSIEIGNLSPLDGMIDEEKIPELTERFEKVMSLKDYDVNDVEAGREYIEAYVKFFKFAEGEEEHGEHGTIDAHAEKDAHIEETHEESISVATSETEQKTSSTTLPWVLAGIFFTTNIIAHVKLFKLKKEAK